MVHTVSLVPLVWPKHTINDLYRKSKYSMKHQEIPLKQIYQKCRQIVPTPRGSILQPPRASQVPHNAKNQNIQDFVFFCIFSLYTPDQPPLWTVC